MYHSHRRPLPESSHRYFETFHRSKLEFDDRRIRLALREGEYWLERHLEKAGKTKEELAKELYDRNLTAVAEVSLHLPGSA